ncbi:MAG: replicative DNA helicase [Candidatus Berkelbacteria bacterium]|nr:replicative DNA helicase [Candidatus Berkelbacteria bacterium]
MAKQNEAVKLPPQNLEAEQAVLGAILIDKDALYKIAELLQPDDFYRDDHREIFSAMLGLFEKRSPIDLVTLTDALRKNKKLDMAGGATYLTHLANSTLSSAHITKHAEIVSEKGILRRLIKAATQMIEDSYSERDEIPMILDRSEQVLFAVSQKFATDKFIAVKDVLAETFDRINELHENRGQLRGIASGFKGLDNLLAGFQRSDLIIIAARPSMGKTALALNIACHAAAKEKIPVGVFSLEMSRDQLVDRLLTMEAGIDSWRLRTGNLREDDFSKLNYAMGVLSEAPLYIDDSALLSVMDIRAKARRLQAESGLGLVIVDYLQLMESAHRGYGEINRVQEVSDISRGLKALARELNVPVIALSQLSRAVESRHPKIPQLADLRESGCLAGDTLVFDARTGLMKKIADLEGEKKFKCAGADDKNRITPQSASKVFCTGTKEVYLLTLSSGKQIKATGNHKFKTIDSWERLDSLNGGDFIATARNVIDHELKVDVSDNKLIVLAHLIGDGCYLKKQPLHYTNADQLCLAAVNKAAAEEFGTKNRLVQQENWYHLYLSANEPLARGRRNPIVKWFDEELAIFDQRSGEKNIPDIVFRLSKKKLALFLKYLFATDGGLTKSAGQWRLHYASKSRTLIEGLQHLLLRFEVFSIIKQNRKKGYATVYDLQITGKENQLKFLNQIGIFGAKEANVQKAIKELSQITANTNIDVIPKQIWDKIKNKLKERGINGRDFHKMMGWAYSGTQRYNNGISRVRLEKIAKTLKDQELHDFAQSDVFWEKIVSIEKCGVEKVYDITVPSVHNFVANNVVVHNSIEQDADVVMFIYREEYYDPETEKKNIAQIMIKKHRNGPIGDIDLFFSPEFSRFSTIEKRIPEAGE